MVLRLKYWFGVTEKRQQNYFIITSIRKQETIEKKNDIIGQIRLLTIDSKKHQSIIPLANLFPNILSAEEMYELDDEFRDLRSIVSTIFCYFKKYEKRVPALLLFKPFLQYFPISKNSKNQQRWNWFFVKSVY